MVYLKSVENVITLGKLMGLLFLFCLPLLSILFLKTKRNDLARPVMGTIFLVKHASGESEAFSLVMKSNNCLRLCVLTRNACLHQAYVSPLGEHVLNLRVQLASPTLGYAHKKSCPTVFKSIESLDGDYGISIRSTPEIVLSSKRN